MLRPGTTPGPLRTKPQSVTKCLQLSAGCLHVRSGTIEEEPDPGPTKLETDAVAVEAPAPSRWAGILRERGPTGRVLMSMGANMSVAIDCTLHK